MSQIQPKHEFKFLLPLAALYVAMQLLSDVTAGKLVQLGGQTVSISVFYFPITFIFSDVLTEVYGFAQARRIVWLVLACSVLGAGISLLVSLSPPAPGFEQNAAYASVFGLVPRIVLAGWIATWCGEMSNNYVIARMKVRFAGRYFGLRAVVSTVVGQLINTGLFYVLGLGGEIPAEALLYSVASAWALKVGVETLCLPITSLAVNFLKREEGQDKFDREEDLSPFSFSHAR